MKFAGVDACKKGWFVVSINQRFGWKIEIFPDIFSLWHSYQEASLILIDIPIGLPCSDSRQCDIAARKILKKRASTVFPAPSREAIYATDYKEACEINEQILGKRLSRQTWNISSKIKQLDELLTEDSNARNCIRESHPEVCFWALAGGKSMRYRKKSLEGTMERLIILTAIFPESKNILDVALTRYKRRDLAVDDILDALSLAVTASSPPETLIKIPAFQERDAHNLVMEIVYSNRNLTKKEFIDNFTQT